jgi:hypothetical protein
MRSALASGLVMGVFLEVDISSMEPDMPLGKHAWVSPTIVAASTWLLWLLLLLKPIRKRKKWNSIHRAPISSAAEKLTRQRHENYQGTNCLSSIYFHP